MWASKDMNSGPDSEDLCYRYMVRWFDNEDTFYEYVVCVTSHQNWPDQYGMTAPSEAVQLNEGS